jgi:hypothetical protein
MYKSTNTRVNPQEQKISKLYELFDEVDSDLSSLRQAKRDGIEWMTSRQRGAVRQRINEFYPLLSISEKEIDGIGKRLKEVSTIFDRFYDGESINDYQIDAARNDLLGLQQEIIRNAVGTLIRRVKGGRREEKEVLAVPFQGRPLTFTTIEHIDTEFSFTDAENWEADLYELAEDKRLIESSYEDQDPTLSDDLKLYFE